MNTRKILYLLGFLLLMSSTALIAQGISVDLGKTEQGRYMKLVGNTGDGAVTQKIKIGTEMCAKNVGTSMYFDIADDFFSKLAAGSYVIVNVEYYDSLNTTIHLVYDAQANHTGKTHADVITTAGTGKWKSTAFFVDDAYFDNGLTNAADLKIVSSGTMFINAVSVVPFDKYINYGDGPMAGGVNDSDDVQGLTHTEYQGGDSRTRYELIGGQMCITGNASSQYLYLAVDDTYIYNGNHPYVFVSVEYYDPSPTDAIPFDPNKRFRLQYAAPSANYKSTSYVYQKGWGCFRTYTFEISDALFNNIENGASDMRLNMSSAGIFINRVTVAILPKKPLPNLSIPNQTAFKALEPPTLDGNVTEWSWLNPYTLQPLFATDNSRTDEFYRTWMMNSANVPVAEVGETGVTDPGVPGLWDTKDLMGWYRMQWDDTKMYFAMVVKDNVVDVAGANWSEKDGFGFYIDVSHTYTGTPQTPVAIKDDDTFQQGESFIFFPATNSELAVWRHSTNPTGEVLTAASGIEKSFVLTDSGYIIEASVPLSLLKDGLTWNPGVTGDKDNFSPLFAYMLNDADNVGASSGRLMFNGHNDDDEFWGTLTLAPLPMVDKGIIVDLGAANYNNLMTQVGTTSGDGVVSALQKAGKNCVKLTNLYAYFNVQDDVIGTAKPHNHLLISVEYLDSAEVAGEQFKIHYNSPTNAYQSYPTYVTLGYTNTWKTAIFEINDAKFTGAQSNSADFRVRCTKNSLVINQVRVVIADLWHCLADTTGYGFTDKYPGSDGLRAAAENIGGYKCQTNSGTASYMYFAAVDTILKGDVPKTTHSEVFLTVEYYDTTSTNAIALNYDGITNQWSDGVGNAFILGTNQWKLHTFYLTDAFFTNRENGGSDFRINSQGSKQFFVHRIFLGAVDAGLNPPTGVEDVSAMPYVFSLSPNYPNPFNPSTTIKYSLAKEGLATLRIYNLLGQEVATLVNTVQHAGNFSVQWNASHFATGVYFYRLTQGDNVKVQKLVLMK
jgi:hypothetical protein